MEWVSLADRARSNYGKIEGLVWSVNLIKNFAWKLGHPLPEIKPHSDRKLKVIEGYLDVYFDTVINNPRVDNLNITLVDGFCGGGVFQGADGLRYGSPVSILRCVAAAEARINASRRKPLRIDAVYHFGDSNKNHIDFLIETIAASEFKELLGKRVFIHHRKFTDLLPLLLSDIRQRQKKGRSIFVLDQLGYSDVPMASIQRIFAALPKAEIILTFSLDALLNYLQTDKPPLDVVRQFGVSDEFLKSWEQWKQEPSVGRLLGQRALMTQLHRYSGARFFTPFMMFSSTDKRDMMIAHLSQSQIARDKMLGVHWINQNTFNHIGKGSLFELGFDERVPSSNTLFTFTEADRRNMLNELSGELPSRIFDLAGGGPLSLNELLQSIGNNTAATNNDITATLQTLSEAQELEFMSPTGGFKRPGSKLRSTDLIRISQQMAFKL